MKIPLVLMGLVVLSTEFAVATDDLGTHVTAANYQGQRLRFNVETSKLEGSGTRYRVWVERGTGGRPTNVQCVLSVVDEKMPPIVNCPLASKQLAPSVAFEFIVSDRFVANSILSLQLSYDKPLDVPGGGGEGFWFYLKDLKDTATALKGAQARD